MRERSPRPRATPRGDNSAPTTGPKPAARRERLRRRPRREAAPVPTAPPPSGGSPNHRAGGSPRGAREALTLQRLLRLLRLLWIKFQTCAFGCILCLWCLLWINFQRYRLGRTLLHAFRNDYRKNIKKQTRHPKEITPIKSYQKYAYFAFPHAHVPYIIGEPPQNLV